MKNEKRKRKRKEARANLLGHFWKFYAKLVPQRCGFSSSSIELMLEALSQEL